MNPPKKTTKRCDQENRPTPRSRRKIGDEFEQKASDYLLERGYRILARNVVYRFGEIDIVAEKDSTLVFVEVRKRDPRYGVTPLETVTYAKQLRLRTSIQAYLARYRGIAESSRIDLIGFIDRRLVHYENFLGMN